MRPAGILAFIASDARGARGRLVVFTASIAVGVAAVVAVAGLSEGVEAGLRARSRELLAADLEVRSAQPLPVELDLALASSAPAARRTDVRELATMVAALDADGRVRASRLVELKVVDGEYPLYGALELEPAESLAALLGPGAAVVAPELCATLGLALGAELEIGGQRFAIAGLVHGEPDRLDFSLALGPRVFLSRAGFERTALTGAGNRVRHRALLALDPFASRAELEDARDALRERLPDEARVRIETHFDAQPGVRRGLERFGSYLGLVALLSLVLGGIGVAETVRAWLAARTADIAVWKCIGLTPREILALHLGHVALFAAAGSALGAAAGGALPHVLPALAPEFLDPDFVRGWQPFALARGVLLGIGVSALFALLALVGIWRVPPALVLRATAEPLAAPLRVRAAAASLLAAGLVLAARIQSGRWDFALAFAGGLAAAALVLYLGARALLAAIGFLPRARLGAVLGHGCAALARPGAGTVGAIVALGLGALVVLAMAFVEQRLEEELLRALPADAPSVFLVDIQPSQRDGVLELLRSAGAENIEAVPVLMARLASIDGASVGELAAAREAGGGSERPRWVLTREQRLTWIEHLPESNRLAAGGAADGALWSDPALDEISLEEEYAADLGVGLGARLAFDVQGVPFEFVVTSLRAVEWESFAINFFLAVEPGVLDDAPQLCLAAARLAAAREDAVQNELVEAYPNVTLLRVRPILEKLAAVFSRMALGVRWLGSLTVLAGLAILAGSVAARELRRRQEVALWKTLGVTRARIVQLFAVEFALTGLVAGALGGLGAWLLAGLFLERVVELEPRLPLAGLARGVLATTALATLAGLAASLRALAVRPIRTLRSG